MNGEDPDHSRSASRVARATKWAGLAFGLATSACIDSAIDEAEPDESDSSSDTSVTAVTALVQQQLLKYEGSCNWLLHCSRPSIDAGRVSWGCKTKIPSLQTQTCSDTLRWVAVPSDDYCGLPIKICTSSGRCAEAQGWDISSTNNWEASPKVMQDLGMPVFEALGAAPPSTCYGGGGGAVNVYRGTWGVMASTSVPANQSITFTFTPNKQGTHAIDFLNNSSIYNSGTMQYCWRAGAGSWSCWATDPVTNQNRRTILFSGSADISYRFTYKNTTSGSATLFRRFYTGW